jgi:hypothetical protein
MHLTGYLHLHSEKKMYGELRDVPINYKEKALLGQFVCRSSFTSTIFISFRL